MMEKEKIINLLEILALVIVIIALFFGMKELYKSEEQAEITLEKSLQLQQEQIEVLKNLEIKIK